MQDQQYRWVTDLLFGKPKGEIVPLTVSANKSLKRVGFLQITFDSYEESISFVKRAAMILLSGIIKNLLLAVFLFFIFYRYLAKPIERLTRSLSEISPGNENNPRLPFDAGYQGEFRLMYEKLNLLIDELNEASHARDQIQKSLNDVNLALEKKVRLRTQDYKQQKDAADKANLAKSQFLATMSHEIRTPLNTILGLSSLADRSGSVEQLSSYLSSINTAGLTLMSLFDEIADFAQIESNKVELRTEVFAFRTLLTDVYQTFQTRFADKGIEFELIDDALLPEWVHADFTRLKQILLNLVSNALKFTHQGKVILGCELLQENAHNQAVVVRFRVQDSGVGIPEAFMQAMFNPFSQADMSTTRLFHGMGLGLALAAKIASLMDSKIEVESQEGVGSTFFLKVQLAVAAAPECEQNPDIELANYRQKLSGKKLLLVEDIEINRFIVEEMLHDAGLKVTMAVNGQEAIDRCQEEDFDIVLMDVQMPVMDGCEATYMIRHQLENKALPVIALTANSLPQDKERCIQSGMNDFLAKPVQQRELLEKIASWV
jgi:signal transduction histidine kinase/BarA-like signal transduction histidine kinase